MPHALIVEDDANARHAMAELVRMAGFSVTSAANLAEARIQLTRHEPDIVLIDLRLPDGRGVDLLPDIETRAGIQVVLVTGYASVETAVEALRLGVADYLVKPVDVDRLNAILARVPNARELKNEIGQLRDELHRLGRFGSLVGRSPSMLRLYDQIARVAPTEAGVFIVGESGTGKELVARTVHDLSARRSHPFIAVNCGAISPNLIESEMFGHERGSFTGAEKLHRGYFEQANGGTLFLDEITEMPPDMQVSLLRVLETRTVMRVGTATPVATDVRIIAATNRDPAAAVKEGKLRADLYHRLNVFPLQIPPLRERTEDIGLIAQAFVDDLNTEENEHRALSPETIQMLRSHEWPGNVRELKNSIHRLFILDQLNTTEPRLYESQAMGGGPSPVPAVVVPLGTTLARADQQLIVSTLEYCGGDRKRTADMLGICVKTLYNKLRAM